MIVNSEYKLHEHRCYYHLILPDWYSATKSTQISDIISRQSIQAMYLGNLFTYLQKSFHSLRWTK